MKSVHCIKMEEALLLAAIEQFIADGGWLGASWPIYPQFKRFSKEAILRVEIPDRLWLESQDNFRIDSEREHRRWLES